MGFPGIKQGLGTRYHLTGDCRGVVCSGSIKAVSQQGRRWEVSPNGEMLFRTWSNPNGALVTLAPGG